MTIIKCKMCGGDLTINSELTYGTCESCGSVMTLPKASDERKANLFNRANHFRRLNDFDKALSAYESILTEDNTDAEAHWGIVLSRYGIEYVEDPISHQRIPTCHRVQFDSILTDADYLAALEYAPDGYTRRLYEEEARSISEIQKRILAISEKEEPFDVFICYKDSTDGGSRTKDSTLAQDIYHQLTNEGYKVFFSRITLEEKLGQEYEPYIFAALNSAKVMLVVGTKPEYFNAVWVRNEWSRYLALLKKDRSRLLIPCYRDMDAYDLPEELSMLQSQDMGKIGFIQDLVRGIKKVVENSNKNDNSANKANPSVEPLLKRAFLCLEDGDLEKADDLLEQVLNTDPECAKAYVGKLMVERHIEKEIDIPKQDLIISNSKNYDKAIRFADESYKVIIEGYEKSIQEKVTEKSRESMYNSALKDKADCHSEELLRAVAKKFRHEFLIGYKDSNEQAVECDRLALEAKNRKNDSISKYTLIDNRFNESFQRLSMNYESLKADREKIKDSIFSAKKLRILDQEIIEAEHTMKELEYQYALELLDNKNYRQAYLVFRKLSDFKDSKNQLKKVIGINPRCAYDNEPEWECYKCHTEIKPNQDVCPKCGIKRLYDFR